MKAEESFPITPRCYTKGQFLDGTDCEILIDSGVSPISQNPTFLM